MSTYLSKILDRILENTNTTTNKGIIVASPSTEPPYKYHWIRDSALVMRVLIDMYKKTKDSKYFEYIINYIENEIKVQELDTISGLGEPKINIDCSPYNGEWGRPQNDGPALRSIMMLKILNIFKYKYESIIKRMIIPIIMNDLNYILENYNKPSFDIWEEQNGWHFYTRMVQFKFLKDTINNKKDLELNEELLKKIEQTYKELSISIKDHFGVDGDNGTIISSFNKDGEIIKYEDSANILAFCHIDFDKDILEIVPLDNLLHTINNLLDYFRNKYGDNDLNLIGRYKDDKYYGGQIWIICSLALAQTYLELYIQRNKSIKRGHMERAASNPNNELYVLANNILERIISLDVDFILQEQFDPNNSKYYSAKKLTWNYSELYILINNLEL